MSTDAIRWGPAALCDFADAVSRLHAAYFCGGVADPRSFLARVTITDGRDDAAANPAATPTVCRTAGPQSGYDDVCQRFAALLGALAETLLDLADRARESSRIMTAADQAAAARMAGLRRPAAAPSTARAASTAAPLRRPPVGHRLRRAERPADPPAAADPPVSAPDPPVPAPDPPLSAPPAYRPPASGPGAARHAAPRWSATPSGPLGPVPGSAPGHAAAGLPTPHPAAAPDPTTVRSSAAASSPAVAVTASALGSAAAAAAVMREQEERAGPRWRPRGAAPPAGPSDTPTARSVMSGTGQPDHASDESLATGRGPIRRRPHERRGPPGGPTAAGAEEPPLTPGNRASAARRRALTAVEADAPPDPDARLAALAHEFPAAREALEAARRLLAGAP